MWEDICNRLSETLGKSVVYQNNRPVSGSCIHHAHELKTSQGSFFVKTNTPENFPVFKAEAEGLGAIKASDTIRCPKVYLVEGFRNHAVLVLEFIPMRSGSTLGMITLGSKLAAMHKTSSDSFGWHLDNNIGLTPQRNSESWFWIPFFKECRLQFQIDLCRKKGLQLPGISRLLENLDHFFIGYDPVPSLLHGDLWGGNIGFDESGNPVVFDPACYFGDREADLAFTEMFGGFSPAFYEAYEQAYPIDPGYRLRKRLYNLYHELNHFYLFGGSYGNQATATVSFLLGNL